MCCENCSKHVTCETICPTLESLLPSNPQCNNKSLESRTHLSLQDIYTKIISARQTYYARICLTDLEFHIINDFFYHSKTVERIARERKISIGEVRGKIRSAKNKTIKVF